MAKTSWVLPPNYRVPQNQFFTSTGATIIPLIARGASGQTANVFEVRNSANTVLFSVDNSGNLIAAGTATISIDEAVTGNETITGNLVVNGNTTLGNAAGDSLTINATLGSNLLFTDGLYDIGASGATRPRDFYLSRNAIIGGTLTISGITSLSEALLTSNIITIQKTSTAAFRIQTDSGITTVFTVNTASPNVTVLGSGTITVTSASAFVVENTSGTDTLVVDTSTPRVTISAQLLNNTNSALSTPVDYLTGTWITGGSATTTKPHLLIEPTGTTSTGWSTSGTGLGINAAAGFAGNLLDLQLNGAARFNVLSTGGAQFGNSDTTMLVSSIGTLLIRSGNGGTSLAVPVTLDNTGGNFSLGPSAELRITVPTGVPTFTTLAVSGGSQGFTFVIGAHTAVIAEVIDLSYAAHTMTITGGYATQRFVNWASPTITAASALTITEVIAHEINGPLPAGSAIFTDSVALNLPTYATNGTTASGLRVAAPTGASNNFAINVTSGTSLFTDILMANGSHFQDINAGTVRNIFLVQSGTPNVVFDNTNDLKFTTAANGIVYRISGADRASLVGTTNGYGVQINAAAVAAGEAAFIVNQAAHTAVVAEQPALSISTATITLADTTTIAEYGWARIAAPTFAGVAAGGAEVITDAATLIITGDPINGGNITLTRSFGLWNKGKSRFDGAISFGDETVDIGTSTVGLNDLHFGSGGIINFDGGDVTLTHSANILTLGGGDLNFEKEVARTIQIADSTTADTVGAALTIKGATGAATNAAGGAINLTGGAGIGTGDGGALVYAGGAGGATGAGGAFTWTTGAGGSTSGLSGAITLATGTTTAASGSATGAVTLQSGAGSTHTTGTAGASGDIILRSQAGGAASGAAGIGGASGALSLTTGNGGASSDAASGLGGAAGTLTITGGNGGAATGTTTGGAGAAINITAGNGGNGGTASGAAGTLTLTAGSAGTGGNVGGGSILLLPGNNVGNIAVGKVQFGSTIGIHLNTTQTTAPTTTLTSTTLNDGAGSGAAIAVTAGSTDTDGSFQVTAGNGTPGAGIAGQIVFNEPYAAAPKTVMLTSKDADGTNNAVYISAASTTSFQVSFNTALSASEVVDFYYLVIE